MPHSNRFHYSYGNRIPLNPMDYSEPNWTSLTRVYPNYNQPNQGDSYCNQGLCRGNYPVPFSPSCNSQSQGGSPCYPYASIVSLISLMIRFKNSGISYDVIGNMFDTAFTLYNNNTGRPPYFVTDYTYAVLRSILVGSYADQYINSYYPPDYYDRVIASLSDLQKRQNDYDYRFQLNGQLLCYLVNSLQGIVPNVLNTPYQPNLNPSNTELNPKSSGALF